MREGWARVTSPHTHTPTRTAAHACTSGGDATGAAGATAGGARRTPQSRGDAERHTAPRSTAQQGGTARRRCTGSADTQRRWMTR